MVSKKYTLLAGFFCLVASCCLAQVKTGGGYDVADSSVVPSKRMPQHSEFLNGTYNFPAKPRNQWEIGLKAGAFTVAGDIPALFPTLGFGVHARKAFGYVFSMRVEYMHGSGKGYSWQAAGNYGRNTGLIQQTPKYSTFLLEPGPVTGQPRYIVAGTGAVATANTP